MLNLILFGPPGSGKGTQASKLVEKFKLLHISTGDLFRYEMGHNTELGQLAKDYMSKGQLVPDEVTIGMLKNKLDSTKEAQGYILDGFPRTITQAEALDKLLEEKNQSISFLLSLDVDDEEIVQRIMLRGKTSGRPDDNDEEIVRKRIQVYNEETAPVFDYYNKQNKSVKVNGIGTVDEIFDRLCTVINTLR